MRHKGFVMRILKLATDVNSMPDQLFDDCDSANSEPAITKPKRGRPRKSQPRKSRIDWSTITISRARINQIVLEAIHEFQGLKADKAS